MGLVTTWSRSYRDRYRIATGFFALFASAVTCVLLVGVCVSVLAGHESGPGADAVGLVPIFMALCSMFVWRLRRTALLTSATGVRVRWLFKTRTLDWGEISGFRFDPDFVGVDRLWIDLADGRRLRKPVQRVHRMRYGSLVNDGGTWLLYDASDDLSRVLGQRLQAGRASL